jgi:hypothetical protein
MPDMTQTVWSYQDTGFPDHGLKMQIPGYWLLAAIGSAQHLDWGNSKNSVIPKNKRLNGRTEIP